MTAPMAPAITATAPARPPRTVVVAFYLWWAPITWQLIGLAYILLTFSEAARIGGPAWDVLLNDGPSALLLPVVCGVEIAFLFPMRRGMRAARIVLTVVGFLIAAALALLPTTMEGNPAALLTAFGLVVAVTIAAVVLMFVPSSNHWFAGATDAGVPDAALDTAAPVTRRPLIVTVAFWMWWVIVLAQFAFVIQDIVEVAQYGVGILVNVWWGDALDLAFAVVAAVFTPSLGHGSRVARIVLTVGSGVTLLLGLVVEPLLSWTIPWYTALFFLFLIAATVLLFVPVANRFFARRQAQPTHAVPHEATTAASATTTTSAVVPPSPYAIAPATDLEAAPGDAEPAGDDPQPVDES
ncbi:hypothetical protein [Microbacterium candidum]|uniref:MFS transporter n=1 Tax=Microbacterium candidum TaxID=3041922 RepID=A0ABT7MY49_9MICO|nr:hypothetical protein [Microbacterium sp. ASV49]MDL9979370.1 hypothetical protein [Microbacterium sp. ASV49]